MVYQIVYNDCPDKYEDETERVLKACYKEQNRLLSVKLYMQYWKHSIDNYSVSVLCCKPNWFKRSS